jgi:hypothetical protein
MIQKLLKVQADLKAPKSQFNSFGKYNYRNQEDILEAVKPLLYANGLLLTITDQVISSDENMFIEAVATVTDGENSISVKAQAGLDLVKKGMDKSQATGAASSYARKYALNGLFLIDDTKDADATNTHGKTTTSMASLLPNTEAYAKVVAALKGGKFTVADVKQKYVLSADVEKSLSNL